jgi:hypothetical protein
VSNIVPFRGFSSCGTMQNGWWVGEITLFWQNRHRASRLAWKRDDSHQWSLSLSNARGTKLMMAGNHFPRNKPSSEKYTPKEQVSKLYKAVEMQLCNPAMHLGCWSNWFNHWWRGGKDPDE